MTISITSGRLPTTLLTACAPVVWGTTYIVTTELLPPGQPLFAALMRALPAGLIAVAISRRLPRRSWWWKTAVLGTLNIGLFFALLFVAAQRLPGGVAATLGATQPLIIVLLATLILPERLSRWRLAWAIVGVVGVGCVVLGPGAGFDALGIAAGVAASASMGVGMVLMKRWGRPPQVGAVGYTGWLLTAGGIALILPALALEGLPRTMDATALGGYLWLGLIGGLLAYTLWFRGVNTLPVTATALLALLSPLVAAALGVFYGGESFTPLQCLGFALALTALAAGQFTSNPLASQGHRP